MSRLPAVVTGLSLLAACAPGPSFELPPVRIPSMQEFMGVAFPLEAGPYSAMDTQRYLDPKFGVRIGYLAVGGGDRVDIYVYPATFARGQSETPLDVDSGLEEEFKKARAELRDWAFERRGATGVRSVSDTTIQVVLGADTLHGLWGDFEISRDDQSYMSSLAVFLKDSSFVKARHSVGADSFETSSETMMDLMREFLGSVQP
ncbi:MAG: hypothetical protein ABFS14_05825 [Gemmatimonadota bacterium]